MRTRKLTSHEATARAFPPTGKSMDCSSAESLIGNVHGSIKKIIEQQLPDDPFRCPSCSICNTVEPPNECPTNAGCYGGGRQAQKAGQEVRGWSDAEYSTDEACHDAMCG